MHGHTKLGPGPNSEPLIMSKRMESLARSICSNPLKLHGAGFPIEKKNAVSRKGEGCQADKHNRCSPQKAFQSNLLSGTERQQEVRSQGWGTNCGTHLSFLFPHF